MLVFKELGPSSTHPHNSNKEWLLKIKKSPFGYRKLFFLFEMVLGGKLLSHLDAQEITPLPLCCFSVARQLGGGQKPFSPNLWWHSEPKWALLQS